MRRFALVLALVGLAACDRPPQPPDKTAPPEPQVAAPTLRAPLDRAAGMQRTLDAARQALGAQTAVAGG
jgi:hypothetical protein